MQQYDDDLTSVTDALQPRPTSLHPEKESRFECPSRRGLLWVERERSLLILSPHTGRHESSLKDISGELHLSLSLVRSRGSTMQVD